MSRLHRFSQSLSSSSAVGWYESIIVCGKAHHGRKRLACAGSRIGDRRPSLSTSSTAKPKQQKDNPPVHRLGNEKSGSTGSRHGGGNGGDDSAGASNGTSTTAVLTVASLLNWYSRMLDTNPLMTKGVSSGIIAGSGDLVCQVFIEGNNLPLSSSKAATPRALPGVAGQPNDEGRSEGGTTASEPSDWRWDAQRTARFTILGTILVAPAVHYWYGALSTRILPGKDAISVAYRVILDQFAFSPVFVPVWLTSLWTLDGTAFNNNNGDGRGLTTRLIHSVPTILTANWALWIPAQAVNFRFVPVKYQVLFSNVVALVWNVYLSHSTNRKKQT